MSYRSDEEAQAYKRIADLEDENRKLRASVPKKARWTMPKLDLGQIALWTLYLFGTAFVGCLLYMAISAIRSAGDFDYCYTRGFYSAPRPGNNIGLYGHRKWSCEDPLLSKHDTVTDAVKAAEQLHCPLMRKP